MQAQNIASLKMVIAEHVKRASATVSRTEDMKDVCDDAVTSAANSWKRMDAMCESQRAAKARNVQSR